MTPSCTLCRQLPRASYSASDYHVPEALARLEPKVELRGARQELRCPECGAAYVYTYEIDDEWPSPNESFDLVRVPAVRDQLDHPDPWVRAEAAHDQAVLLLGQGDQAGLVSRLLVHPQPEVRHAALDAVKWPDATEPVVARAHELLADPDAAVRGRAAEMLTARQVARRDFALARALIESDDPAVRGAALGSLYRGTAPGDAAVPPLAPRLIALLGDADDPSRRLAASLVARLVADPAIAAAAVAALARALDDASREIRWHAATTLKELLRRKAPIDGAMPVLARRIEDPTVCFAVAEAILHCADRELDLSPLVPALVRLVARPIQDAWPIFNLCALALERRAALAQALVMPLWGLARDKRHGHHAKRALERARASGCSMPPGPIGE